jgi:TusA-related sulfurtransferase
MSRADATSLARADREVDVSGLSSPLPILRTRKALNDMASGQTIRVPSTGVRDIQPFSRHTGNERDGAFRFVLKRR